MYDRRLRGVLDLATGRNSLGAGDAVPLSPDIVEPRTESPEHDAEIFRIRWGAVGFG